jgi:hypothetical protein
MKKFIPILLLAIATFSCQPAKEKTTETVTEKNFYKERTEFLANMQPAVEIAAQLQATGADFNPVLMNASINYVDLGADTLKRAANLGVYLADLNYSVAYKQASSSKEVFQNAYTLSKSLGVDETILSLVMSRFEQNIDQNDSVESALRQMFTHATEGLQGPDKERVLGVVMAGYGIESLHLAIGIIETYPKDILPEDARMQILIPLFRLILEKQALVETIHTFLRTLGDASDPERTPNFAFFDNAFGELIDVYKRLNVEEAIANNQGTTLLNDAVVAELSEKVNAIRNKIVTP